MTDNNSDSIGQGLGAIPGSRERGQEGVPALTGFDPARMAALEKIIRDTLWMAHRYADGRMTYAVEMFNDAARMAMKLGVVGLEDLGLAKDGMAAIAMEAATAGETCNRLDPKDDSAGPQGHRPETGGQ